MKRLLALVLLAACAKAPPEGPAPDVPGLLRNPTAPLASQADVSPARLEGDWVVRQTATSDGFTDDTVLIRTVETGGFTLSFCVFNDCDTYKIEQSGPGRWMLRGLPVASGGRAGEMWILWADFDDRTFVMGDPLGRDVWILDRNPDGGADRIAAARDILKWYGYDLSKLETVQ